jgi:hypothetical protein
MPSTINPGAFTQRLEDLATGLKQKPPAGSATLPVDGKTEQVSDLASEVEGYHGTWSAAETTADAHAKAVKARDKIAVTVRKRITALSKALKGALGATNPDLKDYGIKPDKVPEPLTTEKQAQKNAKNKATREARHTMGSKQKKAVKGQVATPPATAPASPTPPAAPKPQG